MKRVFSVFLALMLCAALAVQVSAARMPRLVDGADLLTDAEEAELLAYLDRVSEEYQTEVVIVTLEELDGYSPDRAIEAFYDDHDYGIGPNRDGVMLMLSMVERDYRILSNGLAADAISLNDIDEIGEDIVEELSDGLYMEAFTEFVGACAYQINGELNGFPFPWKISLPVSLIVGFFVAFIATGSMRADLKSVRSQAGAREYTRPGSMQVTRSSDLFLYRTLDRRRKPKENSSGYSRSSGGGGGGRNVGGGKF